MFNESTAILALLNNVFRRHGYDLYLVGGAVRDRLQGVDNVDLDFATSAKPEQTAGVLSGLTPQEPYRVGEKFGTIGLVIEGYTVEVTTYRSQEIYQPGSRKPQVTFGETVYEDLARRDFTINAMAREVLDDGSLSEALVDPYAGAKDVAARVFRHVGEAFAEDPVRILRCARFAARFVDFSVAP
jgi:poly(A) polymerase